MATDPTPEGYTRVTPYLCVDGAADAIEFYKDVFGATERMRIGSPDGKIGHSELEIGEGRVMVADEYAEMDVLGPRAIGGTPVSISVYVDDVDATFARALELGAEGTRPVEDQFYGDRAGQFTDPWGHRWHIATHIEDVSVEEMVRRSEEMFGS